MNKETGTKDRAGLIRLLSVHFTDLLKLNLIMLASGCLVLSLPAAMTAGSRVLVLMLREQPYSWRADYWPYFKNLFFKSLAGMALLSLGALVTSYLSLFYLYNFTGWLGVLFCTIGVMLFCLLLIALYHFPVLLVTGELSLGACLKNAWLLALARFGANFLTLLAIVGWWCLQIWLFPLSLALFAVYGLSICLLIGTAGAYKNIMRFVIKKDEEENEEEKGYA